MLCFYRCEAPAQALANGATRLAASTILVSHLSSAFRPPAAQPMIGAITLLLVFQLLGEVISRGLALPIPGPVIGMALLFIALTVRGGPSADLRKTAQSMLQHLSLLFIPAGTGVMLHFQRMSDELLPLLVSLLVSTVVTIAVTALVLRFLADRSGKQERTP